MKVHQRQRAFLTDQRSTRLMQIGGVDKKVTAMMERRKSREERMTERQDEEKRRKLNIEHPASSELLSESDKEESDSEDECVVDEWKDVSLPEEEYTSDINLTPIPTVALEADRYSVSNRAAAAICTATLIDYGIVTPDDHTNVVDHHKVWRARQKARKSLKEEPTAEEDIQAIFFDGRKDFTLVKQRI